LVLSGLGAGALQTSQENVKVDVVKENTSQRGTHTALGEFGTATWCPYCRFAHGALMELYAEGNLDFNYVTFVCDKNSVASSYCASHFNLYGYPTLWWDGGYKVNVGAGSVPSAKSTYTSSINQCVARTVYDVDITLDVTWIGGTEMQISCSVDNNEATTYDGTIRVYILEKVSSRAWYDYGGILYNHPFLDFAFNQAVSIPSGGTWSNSMNWIGTSHGYPTVTETNTMVVAAVENNDFHQGYSYPPSSNPFNAYYVDDCVTVDLGAGGPPNEPTVGGPTSGVVGTEYNFQVVATEPEGDNVYYYIDWGDGTNTGWIGPYDSGVATTVPKTYTSADTYDITAKAKDTYNQESGWSDPLTIEIIENNPPADPTITGPAIGGTGVELEYTFVTTDSDGDDVYYWVLWGDGCPAVEWDGPYASGEEVTMSHTFETKGDYTITAKAKDIYDAESGLGSLDIQIPRVRLGLPLFERIFVKFPHIYQILQNLLNY
jgi:thiol-disulfide isomerase/thioredoxin